MGANDVIEVIEMSRFNFQGHSKDVEKHSIVAFKSSFNFVVCMVHQQKETEREKER